MVKIIYNSEEEMTNFSKDEKIIFYGNYWGLNRKPWNIEELFKDLELDVECFEQEDSMI